MRKLFALALCLAFAAPVLADPITGIEEKEWGYGLPFDTRTDVYEAEPNGSCAEANPLACTDVMHGVITTGGTAGDWDYYQFTITNTGTFQFGTDADGATPVTDTYIYLYNSACTQLSSNDDSGPGLYSLITYTITTPGTYYGAVRSYSSSYTGGYIAFIVCPQPPPPNDQCSGAIEIPCNTNIDLAGTTLFATNDYDPGVPGPSCTGYSAAGKDVVYKFTTPHAGAYIDVTYTSAADGSFYIVTDCEDETGTCVVGADATVTGQPEVITWTFTSAGTYYIILDNYGSGSGSWTLVGTLTCPTAVEETSWGKVKTLYR